MSNRRALGAGALRVRPRWRRFPGQRSTETFVPNPTDPACRGTTDDPSAGQSRTNPGVAEKPNEPEAQRQPHEPSPPDASGNAIAPEIRTNPSAAESQTNPREPWIDNWSVSGRTRSRPARRSGCGMLPSASRPEPVRPGCARYPPPQGPGAAAARCAARLIMRLMPVTSRRPSRMRSNLDRGRVWSGPGSKPGARRPAAPGVGSGAASAIAARGQRAR